MRDESGKNGGSRNRPAASTERKNVVILGAGLSGRGYLARQMDSRMYRVTFVDRDEALVGELQRAGSYKISFFGNRNRNVVVNGYEAYVVGDQEAERRILEADYIFTCVGEENLREAGAWLGKIWGAGHGRGVTVIAAENGTESRELLEPYICGKRKPVRVSRCLMLCTTLSAGKGLDILSEDVDYLPYDREALDFELPFANFEPSEDFDMLVRRKLYTYNSLSACIAYLGARKGYENYGSAANDTEIARMTDLLEERLNQAICAEYRIPREEQLRFSEMAKRKFRNPEIRDTVTRNARNAKRKLGAGDRIAGPLKLLESHKIPTAELEIVAAAALWYGIEKEGLGPEKGETVGGLFSRLSGSSGRAAAAVERRYQEFADSPIFSDSSRTKSSAMGVNT